jgi:hypothetical protein
MKYLTFENDRRIKWKECAIFVSEKNPNQKGQEQQQQIQEEIVDSVHDSEDDNVSIDLNAPHEQDEEMQV